LTTLLHFPSVFGISLEVYFLVLVIGTLTFILMNFIFSKIIKASKSKKIASWITTIILSPIIYYAFVEVIFLFLFYEPSYDFTQKRWFDNKELRYQLKDDIVESKILHGKTKIDVINTIGKPDHGDTTELWNYDLGSSCAGFGWQFNYLKIRFENDKVTNVELEERKD
jgi:hypothetical protein